MSAKPDTPRQGAAARRDERHGRTEPTPRHAARKDRKRWCRGKPGVEHRGVCLTYAEAKSGSILAGDPETASWRVLVCENCGKELALWYPMGTGRAAPGWVTK